MVVVKTHPKLEECIKSMINDTKYKLPFYGEYNLRINFHKSESLPTCGVNVGKKGFNFYYNHEFLNKLPQEEVNFVDIHEIFHLLFDHPQRTVAGNFDPKLANIVQDMIINHIIWSDINRKFVQLPKNEKGENMALFPPKEYDGNLIFEQLYTWMREKQQEHEKKKKQNQCSSCGGSGKQDQDQDDQGQDQDQDGQGQGQDQDGQGQGQDQDGQGQCGDKGEESCPDCNGSGQNGGQPGQSGQPGQGKNGKCGEELIDNPSLEDLFDNMDETNGEYLDSHIGDEVPQEYREALVKGTTGDIVERMKMRGLDVGNIEATIEKLRKKRKDYLKEIKRAVSNTIMGRIKHKTITRPNRRGISGLKGHKKIKTKINVILDTSGSMSGLFEKVLAYIFQNDIEVNLIQCDTQVQSVETISNIKKLNTLHIKGLGGTVIQPGVDKITEDFNKYNTCILTDGYTDRLDFSKHRGSVLILTTDVNCPIDKNPMRKLKQIIIDTSYDN
jgi:predicted metal-dependent peptidase